jgi:hypothetical protein
MQESKGTTMQRQKMHGMQMQSSSIGTLYEMQQPGGTQSQMPIGMHLCHPWKAGGDGAADAGAADGSGASDDGAADGA